MMSHRLGAKPVRQPAANCAAVQAMLPAKATAPSSQNKPDARGVCGVCGPTGTARGESA